MKKALSYLLVATVAGFFGMYLGYERGVDHYISFAMGKYRKGAVHWDAIKWLHELGHRPLPVKMPHDQWKKEHKVASDFEDLAAEVGDDY